jgi:hypothetical protein
MMLLFFYIVMFSIQIIVCRSIAGYFCSDLSIFNGPDFTERTHFTVSPNKNLYKGSKRVFPTVSTGFSLTCAPCSDRFSNKRSLKLKAARHGLHLRSTRCGCARDVEIDIASRAAVVPRAPHAVVARGAAAVGEGQRELVLWVPRGAQRGCMSNSHGGQR